MDVVGLSLGGYVGFQLLIRHPHLIQGAMLSGIHIGSLPYARLMLWVMYAMSPLMNLGWFRRKMVLSMGIEDPSLASRSDGSANASSATMRAISRVVTNFDVEEQLSKIKTPTLIMAGAHEHKTIIDALEVYRSGMPSCETKTVLNTGHGWPLEKPQLFVETVRSWVMDRSLPHSLSVTKGH